MSGPLEWEALPIEERKRRIRDAEQRKAVVVDRQREQERAANAKDDRLRRQLAAVVDSDLLVSRLMDACQDPMIQAKIVDALLKSGLVLTGQDPSSFSQP